MRKRTTSLRTSFRYVREPFRFEVIFLTTPVNGGPARRVMQEIFASCQREARWIATNKVRVANNLRNRTHTLQLVTVKSTRVRPMPEGKGFRETETK